MSIPVSSDPLAMSPISRIPYDVLTEIFIHCLPRYRLRVRQPNTQTAPMLLCQICSAWRTVALNSPILWSHLAYRLVIAQINITDRPDAKYDCRVLKGQLAFLSWWRRNQGEMALFLFLETSPRLHGIPASDLAPVADKTKALFTYIASVRYLEASEDFWLLFRNWTLAQLVVSSNPHTLVNRSVAQVPLSWHVQPFLSPSTPSALRYLSLSYYHLHDQKFVIQNEWSKLVRVALNNIMTSLEVWFAFIRAVHVLEWGHFSLVLLNGQHVRPAEQTLPQLSTLSITLHYLQAGPALAFPLSTLLSGLHLPALHTLALSRYEAPWYDHRALTELYTVLRATPAVRTLTLGDFFLSLHIPDDRYRRVILPALGDTEPVWCHAPHLVHLQLWRPRSIPAIAVESVRATMLDNLLHADSRWLGLGSPACPIRRITLLDDSLTSDFLAVTRVRKQIKTVENVEIAVDLEHPTLTAGVWYEWSEVNAFAS